jgi:N-acetylglutamate synthase/N-acetylornithine aminotransferase
VNAAPAADAPPVELCPVAGVRLAAVEAGIRYADRLDLVAIAFDEGTQAAAVFTRNAFRAAPVQVAQRHLEVRRPAATAPRQHRQCQCRDRCRGH